jgi:hypothetical protein
MLIILGINLREIINLNIKATDSSDKRQKGHLVFEWRVQL